MTHKQTLYLAYEEHNTVISDTYGEDGPYSGYTEEQREVTFKNLFLKRPPHIWRIEEIVIDEPVQVGTPVVLVVPRWTDGGTFGQTHGYWQVEGVFTDLNKASELAESIRNRSYKKERDYLPWTGYFAGLDNVDVEVMTVQ